MEATSLEKNFLCYSAALMSLPAHASTRAHHPKAALTLLKVVSADGTGPLSPAQQGTTSGQGNCSRLISETEDSVGSQSSLAQSPPAPIVPSLSPGVRNRLKGAKRILYLLAKRGNFANWCMSHNSFYRNLFFSHLEASTKDIF